MKTFFKNFEMILLFVLGVLSVALLVGGAYVGSIQSILFGIFGVGFICSIIYINKKYNE